jgi:hypothetical protein
MKTKANTGKTNTNKQKQKQGHVLGWKSLRKVAMEA